VNFRHDAARDAERCHGITRKVSELTTAAEMESVQIALPTVPTTPQLLASDSFIEPAHFRGDQKATAWVPRARIHEWVSALEALLTPEERRDLTERVKRNRPYAEAERPTWGTMLNLYVWALVFESWCSGRDGELPADAYVEAFMKATGIPGPQPTDKTLLAWQQGLDSAKSELRSLREFVTAMTRYRAMKSSCGDAFLPRQIVAIERFTGIKADYAD
jgi:hypothetical protein